MRSAGLAFLKLGGWLRVGNEGQHWSIHFDQSQWITLVEWWPSSGKLVFNKEFKRGMHANTWQKVFRVLKERQRTRIGGCTE